ncbi:MAG: DinB family protein [Bacteroidia bacterium]
MNFTTQIAKHFREVNFGGNWTWSNLKDNLADVSWQQATTKVPDFNTIAALTYHINYFVLAAIDVLEGKPLTSKDEFSFDVPLIQNAEDWKKLTDKSFADAEKLAALIEQLPETKLLEDFTDKKYGNYYRNLHGIIEHTHYHLGQIAILKKMIRQKNQN